MRTSGSNGCAGCGSSPTSSQSPTSRTAPTTALLDARTSAKRWRSSHRTSSRWSSVHWSVPRRSPRSSSMSGSSIGFDTPELVAVDGHAKVGVDRLLLDEVHDRHDGRRLGQLDAQFLHDRPEVRQEFVERLLAVPHIKDLKLAVLTDAAVQPHRAVRRPVLSEALAPLGVLLASHVLGDDVDRNHSKWAPCWSATAHHSSVAPRP